MPSLACGWHVSLANREASVWTDHSSSSSLLNLSHPLLCSAVREEKKKSAIAESVALPCTKIYTRSCLSCSPCQLMQKSWGSTIPLDAVSATWARQGSRWSAAGSIPRSARVQHRSHTRPSHITGAVTTPQTPTAPELPLHLTLLPYQVGRFPPLLL